MYKMRLNLSDDFTENNSPIVDLLLRGDVSGVPPTKLLNPNEADLEIANERLLKIKEWRRMLSQKFGRDEDARLLDKMLMSIGLSKESNCFITNVNEYEGCLRSMKPRFILCLGESASRTLLHSAEPIGKLRGKIVDFKTAGMTIPLIATYHPGELLRNGELKRPAWDDLKTLRAALMPAPNGAE